MARKAPPDPAEKWLAEQILTPGEYHTFLVDPEGIRSFLKARLLNHLRRHISDTGQHSPPFFPEKLKTQRKISEIIRDDSLTSREATLTPTIDGFILRFNPNLPETKIRFNCAHEIGHTYFFDLTTSPPRKAYPVSSSRYWVEEGYACEIAREILAPEPIFQQHVSKLSEKPSLQTLIKIRKNFNISFDVLAKRLLHDAHALNATIWRETLWESIILMAVKGPSQHMNRLEIRSYRSPFFKNRLKNIRNSETMIYIINQAFHSNDIIETPAHFGKTEYRIQASKVQNSNQVTALISKFS